MSCIILDITSPGKIINTHIDMSGMRACRILNISKQDTIIPSK